MKQTGNNNPSGGSLAQSSCSAFLVVEAGVRYWEDATVNGVEDTEGTLIPCRKGDLWNPVIELVTGKIKNWSQGTTADIHYKVCDAGKYWIVDDEGRMMAKWKDDYVPNRVLCIGANGYGDYIIIQVDSDGNIKGWKQPRIESEAWEIYPAPNAQDDRPLAGEEIP